MINNASFIAMKAMILGMNSTEVAAELCCALGQTQDSGNITEHFLYAASRCAGGTNFALFKERYIPHPHSGEATKVWEIDEVHGEDIQNPYLRGGLNTVVQQVLDNGGMIFERAMRFDMGAVATHSLLYEIIPDFEEEPLAVLVAFRCDRPFSDAEKEGIEALLPIMAEKLDDLSSGCHVVYEQ